MTYSQAMQDARVQYAAATGRIDDRDEKEVLQFLEGTMQKAKQNARSKNGYVVIDNGYAYFARKVENGIEAEKESDLEDVLSLIDQGLLKKHSNDRERGATYYVAASATLAEMETLLKETGERLNDAKLEYARRLKKYTETFTMKESVAHLNGRFKTQLATVNFLITQQ